MRRDIPQLPACALSAFRAFETGSAAPITKKMDNRFQTPEEYRFWRNRLQRLLWHL